MTSGQRTNEALTDPDAAVATLAAAFQDDPITHWLFPEGPARDRALPELFRAQVTRARAAGDLHVAGDGAAVAVWLHLAAGESVFDGGHGSADAEPDAALAPHLRRLATFATIAGLRHPDDRAHLYLPFLGVTEAARGQGLGSRLLATRLAAADADGLGAYLEASTTRSWPLYRRHGFEQLGGPITLPAGPPDLADVARTPLNPAGNAVKTLLKSLTTQGETLMTTTTVAGGPGDFMIVRHVRADGTQAEIGHVLAAEARDRYGWAPLPADPVLARARTRWFERNWPQHHARMRGAATALGVDPGTDRLHLDGQSGVPDGSACSALFCPPSSTVDEKGWFGRNYDFFTTSPAALFAMLAGQQADDDEPPMASRPYLVTSRPDDGPATTVLTMNELDGCMEGINEHGLTVCLLIADALAPNVPVQAGPQVGLSSVQLPRFVLDTCASAAEARQALLGAKQYDLGAALHYLIADPSGDAFVWERGAGGAEHIIDLSGGSLCVTNHPLHRYPDPSALPADNEESLRTYQRHQEISERSGSGGMSGDALRKTLDGVRFGSANAGRYPVRTLWRSVFDLTGRTMATHFYLGDDAAGEPRYSEEVVSGPAA